MNIFSKVQQFLLEVEKPGRYVGNELNTVYKKNYKFHIGISYPDLYEIGMSNYGLQILYGLLNKIDDVYCERVFCPAPDMSDKLLKNNISLYTLETYSEIKDLDLLCFNISHEMLATNVLHMLRLSNIPLRNRDRCDNDPIILAGGDAISNPAPYSLFIDLFSPGEGEEVICEISKIAMNLKQMGKSRNEIIDELAKIDGVYKPDTENVIYNSDGLIVDKSDKVKKRTYRNNNLFDPEFPVVPSIRITHERAVVQVARGCYNLCKFCHSGYYTLPCRFINPEIVTRKALIALQNTGYDGINLLSLSISDYKYLVDVINNLLPELNEKGISLSLPSMKVDKGTLPIIDIVSGVRKASLTFAVESANEEIRKIIHKRVSEDDLIDIITEVFNNGWKTIKLYFMLGLPGYKEYDEVEPAITLLKRINAISRGKNINCTFSPFVPKPHTPFQNEEMASEEYFNTCVKKLKSNLPRNISIKNHDLDISFIEGVIARGDVKVSDLIISAYENGCYLDSWSEYFKRDIWKNLIFNQLTDYKIYQNSREDLVQPWSIIDASNSAIIKNRSKKILSKEELSGNRASFTSQLESQNIDKARISFIETRSIVTKKVRLIYKKIDKTIYLSHLDVLEVMKRALRRAGIPMTFSKGFNKREVVHSGFPLPLGIASNIEYFDLDLFSNYSFSEQKISELNNYLPKGIEIISINTITEKIPKGETVFTYEFNLDHESRNILKNAITEKTMIKKIVKKREKYINISDSIYCSKLEEDQSSLSLFVGTPNSLRIDKIFLTLFPNNPIENYNILKVDHLIVREGNEIKFKSL